MRYMYFVSCILACTINSMHQDEVTEKREILVQLLTYDNAARLAAMSKLRRRSIPNTDWISIESRINYHISRIDLCMDFFNHPALGILKKKHLGKKPGIRFKICTYDELIIKQDLWITDKEETAKLRQYWFEKLVEGECAREIAVHRKSLRKIIHNIEFTSP